MPKSNAPAVVAFAVLAMIGVAGAPALGAETAPAATSAPATPGPAGGVPPSSALDAQLFYEILLGELNLVDEQPGNAYALFLDSARRTGDEGLYRRAVFTALQARAGDSALEAARDWKRAKPASAEANRYVLQILVGLGRFSETTEPLQASISLTPVADRPQALLESPRYFLQSTNSSGVEVPFEQAIKPWLDSAVPAEGIAAWVALGQMRFATSGPAKALQAVEHAHAIDPDATEPVLAAIDLISPATPGAERLVRDYLTRESTSTRVRLAYAQTLIQQQRVPDAIPQLEIATQASDAPALTWLILGTLQVENGLPSTGMKTLQAYLDKTSGDTSDETRRARSQAYLALAEGASQLKDNSGALSWLSRVDDPSLQFTAAQARAGLLARQGKVDEALAIMRHVPETSPGDAKLKLMAQSQLLRDAGRWQATYDLLATANGTALTPDPDLLYEQAMAAEKLGKPAEMETLLRRVIQVDPDYQHAYNALGYSLADRGERLPEARDLIMKALAIAPGDPFITDSLGWVEFRMGHNEEALKQLQKAYQSRPDAEIGTHLGEVLWTMGRQDEARTIWRDIQQRTPGNELLGDTLKRLGVRL